MPTILGLIIFIRGVALHIYMVMRTDGTTILGGVLVCESVLVSAWSAGLDHL